MYSGHPRPRHVPHQQAMYSGAGYRGTTPQMMRPLPGAYGPQTRAQPPYATGQQMMAVQTHQGQMMQHPPGQLRYNIPQTPQMTSQRMDHHPAVVHEQYAVNGMPQRQFYIPQGLSQQQPVVYQYGYNDNSSVSAPDSERRWPSEANKLVHGSLQRSSESEQVEIDTLLGSDIRTVENKDKKRSGFRRESNERERLDSSWRSANEKATKGSSMRSLREREKLKEIRDSSRRSKEHSESMAKSAHHESSSRRQGKSRPTRQIDSEIDRIDSEIDRKLEETEQRKTRPNSRDETGSSDSSWEVNSYQEPTQSKSRVKSEAKIHSREESNEKGSRNLDRNGRDFRKTKSRRKLEDSDDRYTLGRLEKQRSNRRGWEEQKSERQARQSDDSDKANVSSRSLRDGSSRGLQRKESSSTESFEADRSSRNQYGKAGRNDKRRSSESSRKSLKSICTSGRSYDDDSNYSEESRNIYRLEGDQSAHTDRSSHHETRKNLANPSNRRRENESQRSERSYRRQSSSSLRPSKASLLSRSASQKSLNSSYRSLKKRGSTKKKQVPLIPQKEERKDRRHSLFGIDQTTKQKEERTDRRHSVFGVVGEDENSFQQAVRLLLIANKLAKAADSDMSEANDAGLDSSLGSDTSGSMSGVDGEELVSKLLQVQGQRTNPQAKVKNREKLLRAHSVSHLLGEEEDLERKIFCNSSHSCDDRVHRSKAKTTNNKNHTSQSASKLKCEEVDRWKHETRGTTPKREKLLKKKPTETPLQQGLEKADCSVSNEFASCQGEKLAIDLDGDLSSSPTQQVSDDEGSIQSKIREIEQSGRSNRTEPPRRNLWRQESDGNVLAFLERQNEIRKKQEMRRKDATDEIFVTNSTRSQRKKKSELRSHLDKQRSCSNIGSQLLESFDKSLSGSKKQLVKIGTGAGTSTSRSRKQKSDTEAWDDRSGSTHSSTKSRKKEDEILDGFKIVVSSKPLEVTERSDSQSQDSRYLFPWQ